MTKVEFLAKLSRLLDEAGYPTPLGVDKWWVLWQEANRFAEDNLD